MGRVSIELPDSFFFRTEIHVRITDINYGNHLGNDALMGMLQEARMRWLRPFGYTELRIEDVGMILFDAAVQFKAEAEYGDRLEVAMAIEDITPVGFAILYLVTDAETEKEIARAQTGMVFFDYQARRLHRMPAEFRRCLEDV